MRVVVDTNVVVSGLLNPHGSPGRILDAVVSQSLTVLHDDRILAEYREVLFRPAFGFARSDLEVLLEFLDWAGEHISAGPLSVVLPDPTDLPFLEVAISGRADALITGNIKDFKPRRGKHDLLVIKPAEFLRRLGGAPF